MTKTTNKPSPRQLKGLIPFTSETAKEYARLRSEKRRFIIENPDQPLPPELEKFKLPETYRQAASDERKWTEQRMAEIYEAKTFPEEWRAYYKRQLAQLRRKYAPGLAGDHPQYRILCQRVASLATKAAINDTKDDENAKYYGLRLDKELKDFISQLQRYTEAERREVQVTQTIVSTTLEKVVAIGESTIQDPAMRTAFMQALRALVTGETVAAPALLGPGPGPDANVIEAEFTEVGDKTMPASD